MYRYLAILLCSTLALCKQISNSPFNQLSVPNPQNPNQFSFQQNSIDPFQASPIPGPSNSPQPIIPTESSPIPQQTSKQLYRILLQPLMDRYVIAATIHDMQELFSIELKGGEPSWIFIDDTQLQHQICFDGVYQASIPDGQSGQAKVDTQEYCIDVQGLACRKKCQKAGDLNQQQLAQLKSVVGDTKYSVKLFMDKDKQVQKTFIAAKIFKIDIKQDKIKYKRQDKFDQHKLQQNMDQNQLNQQTLKQYYQQQMQAYAQRQPIDFYSMIVGEINIGQYPWLVLENNSQQFANQLIVYSDIEHYISQRNLPSSRVMKLEKDKPQRVSIKYNNIQKHKTQIKFLLKFDQVYKKMSLPSTIHRHLIQIIRDEVLKQCEHQNGIQQQFTNLIIYCKEDKSKQLESQTISFCFQDPQSQCIELNLLQLITVGDYDNENQVKQFSYFFDVSQSDNENEINIYPDFSLFYNVIINSGDIYGFVSQAGYKVESPKAEQAKKQQKQQSHEHHQHTDKKQRQSLLKALRDKNLTQIQQAIQQIVQPIKKQHPVFFKFLLVVLSITCLLVFGIFYLKNPIDMFRRADEQAGSLMVDEDEPRDKRNRIFGNEGVKSRKYEPHDMIDPNVQLQGVKLDLNDSMGTNHQFKTTPS